jgi:DNA-binding transcriptional MerR regulator
VTPKASNRLFSIGEFAAATQLSPKALRLYDEQRILQPATIDPASGYRYYRSDQVSLGRLIRTLRDMGLPLAEVARIVAADRTRAEMFLNECARSLDYRYAREKRAFQTALLLLRDTARTEAILVEERLRPAMTVVVRPFSADRALFYERLRKQSDDAHSALARAGLQRTEGLYCRLIDPLSDEEAQMELLLPIETPALFPSGITLRQLPEAACAVIAAGPALSVQGTDFSGPLDAIFDWFDRRGYRAVEPPWLSRTSRDGAPVTELLWAYEPGSHFTR